MKFITTLLDIICTTNEIYWLYQWVNILLDRKKPIPLKYNINPEWVFMLLHIVVVFMLNNITFTTAWTYIVVFIFNIAAIKLCWKCDIAESVAVSGFYFLAMFVICNIEISLIGIAGGEELIYASTQERGLIRAIYLIIGGFLWFIIHKMMTTFVRKKKMLIMGKEYLVGLTVVVIAGSAFMTIRMLENFEVYFNVACYAFLIQLLIIIFGMYIVINFKDREMHLEVLKAQNEMLERNYRQANEFYTENAKLYHDMHHHFDAVYHMLQQGEHEQAKKYLSKMCSSNNRTQITFWSGINVLDAVLCDMNLRAKKKGIIFTVETVVLPCDLRIDSRDICSLFANLLENAIEASAKEVELKINKINHTLYVAISNDYIIEPIKDGKNFVTQKKDKNMHGWGTQIINQIIEKYEGNIEYETKEGYFNVYAMLNEAD